MDGDVARILLSREQIQQRVRELAGQISAVYDASQRPLTLVPILSGAMIFLADLVRELPLKMKIAIVHVSTYRGTGTSPGEPQLVCNLAGPVEARHVLIVDDILDTGRTLRRVQHLVRQARPASLRTVVLLRKPGKAPADVQVDFVGFDIEDWFVVGYGLDYDDHYRNYPHIGVLRPEIMAGAGRAPDA